MKLYYDFHIHTCLSPCGDDDMTPNNIVNMSLLKGLDAIAITDHNHAGNVLSCIEAAKGTDLLVIGGMEVETSEEIHMIVLFEDLQKLYKLEKFIHSNLPPIKNKIDIFGEQILMDCDDNVVGKEERFLVTACSIDIFTLYDYVTREGGVIFPAHADKKSYSIISNLGSVPPELKLSAIEVKYPESAREYRDKYCVLTNSDAHYLWDISEPLHYIDIKNKTVFDVLAKLQQK